MRQQPFIEELRAPSWITLFIFKNCAAVFTAIEVIFTVIMAEEVIVIVIVYDARIGFVVSIMRSFGLVYPVDVSPDASMFHKVFTTAFRAFEFK